MFVLSRKFIHTFQNFVVVFDWDPNLTVDEVSNYAALVQVAVYHLFLSEVQLIQFELGRLVVQVDDIFNEASDLSLSVAQITPLLFNSFLKLRNFIIYFGWLGNLESASPKQVAYLD